MVRDTLAEFARDVLSMSFADFRPPSDALRAYLIGSTEIHTLVLYREGPFQLEVITSAPNAGGSHIPEHAHPNVDSIDVFLHGELGPLSGILRLPFGAKKRIRHGVFHGASVGEAGSSILCIQHWLNGVSPTSIALDWEGPPHHDVRPAPLMP